LDFLLAWGSPLRRRPTKTKANKLLIDNGVEHRFCKAISSHPTTNIKKYSDDLLTWKAEPLIGRYCLCPNGHAQVGYRDPASLSSLAVPKLEAELFFLCDLGQKRARLSLHKRDYQPTAKALPKPTSNIPRGYVSLIILF
jgi:hypothetical protein